MTHYLTLSQKTIITFVTLLIISASAIFIVKLVQNNYRIVTVDIQALVKDELNRAHIESLSDSQIEQKVREIITQKKRTIADYARRNKLMVLSNQVVFSQVPDITHHFLQLKKGIDVHFGQ